MIRAPAEPVRDGASNVKRFIFDYIRGVGENDPYRDIPFSRTLVPLDGEEGYLYCASAVPPDSEGGDAERAVIVCPPFLEERILSHRLLCRLQKRLALEGMVAVRFDYAGTGDSSGEVSDVTLDTMNRDLGRIVDWTHEMFSPRRIALLGLRLGATVILDHAGVGVDTAVLWSPVVSTRRYIEELYKLQILSATKSGLPAGNTAFFAGRVENNQPVEILGYAVGPDFVRQCSHRPVAPAGPVRGRIHVFRLGRRRRKVYTEELDGLVDGLKAGGCDVDDREIVCPPFWSDGLHLWEEIPELFEETVSCLAQT